MDYWKLQELAFISVNKYVAIGLTLFSLLGLFSNMLTIWRGWPYIIFPIKEMMR